MVVNGVQKGREQVTTMQRPRTQIGGAMLNRGVLTKERDEYDEFVDERDEKKGWNFARIGLHLKRKKVHYVVAFVLLVLVNLLLVFRSSSNTDSSGLPVPVKNSVYHSSLLKNLDKGVILSESSRILQFLQYWRRYRENEPEKFDLIFPGKASFQERKYVTFEDDGGGWNNIRMAFEVFVLVAKITGRILVVPPPCRFYLLDRGPIMTFPKNRKSVSTYSDYFDFDDLSASITVITTEEFLNREAKALGIPDRIRDSVGKSPILGNGKHTEYFFWLRNSSNTVIWPSGPKDLEFSMERIGTTIKQKALVHFPMHGHKGLRYLGGVPALLGSIEIKQDMKFASKEFIRNRLHYHSLIMLAATRVIKFLGGVNAYSSLHIRRNELQYRNVFIDAEHSCNNVSPQLKQGETLYIATDEVEPGFFASFERSGKNFTVFTLAKVINKKFDIFNDMKGHDSLPPKLEGMVEQVVCAAGRRFFGTPSSTFSSYIFRLRGYLYGHSKAAACMFHTFPQTIETDENCRTSFNADALLWQL